MNQFVDLSLYFQIYLIEGYKYTGVWFQKYSSE